MNAAQNNYRLNRVKEDWETVAQESLTVEYIQDAYYAFGSELACLRLSHAYRLSADKTAAQYSKPLKTWFFRLTVAQ